MLRTGVAGNAPWLACCDCGFGWPVSSGVTTCWGACQGWSLLLAKGPPSQACLAAAAGAVALALCCDAAGGDDTIDMRARPGQARS